MYGAREKRIIEIDRIFAEKTAFNRDECIFSRAEFAETEKKRDAKWTRRAGNAQFSISRTTEPYSRRHGNVIKANSEQCHVNLLFPVKPWLPPFLMSHQGQIWCQWADLGEQIALFGIIYISTIPIQLSIISKSLNDWKRGGSEKTVSSSRQIKAGTFIPAAPLWSFQDFLWPRTFYGIIGKY